MINKFYVVDFKETLAITARNAGVGIIWAHKLTIPSLSNGRQQFDPTNEFPTPAFPEPCGLGDVERLGFATRITKISAGAGIAPDRASPRFRPLPALSLRT